MCETRLFCPECWEECSLPDPAGRCRHCFEEMEEEICQRCRNKAALPFPAAFVFEATPAALLLSSMVKENPEAMASFALVQWERLDWPIPDIILPLPKAKGLARGFASLLNCFFADALKDGSEGWECDTSFFQEDSSVLLISVGNSFDEIHQAFDAVSDAFPKRVFVLSLVPLYSNNLKNRFLASSGSHSL